MNLSLQQPMQSLLRPRHASLFINTVSVIFGSILLTIASQIAIPLQPVPLTLQTLAVLFLGMSLGWRLGVSSVIVYLILGAVGLPVFSGWTSGASIILTSGYMFGFIFAAAFSGFLVERGWGKNFRTAALAALAGEIIILSAGLLVLSTYIGWKQAINTGLLPFIPGEFAKIAILAVVIPWLWKSREK